MANFDTAAINLTDAEMEEHPANFSPLFADEVVMELDALASDAIRGAQRRMALLACARSAVDLANFSIEHTDAYWEMMENIKAFKEHAKGVCEIAETAYARVCVADCRGHDISLAR